MRLDGPSRASLLHLELRGNNNGCEGLVVNDCDQSGSRVYVEGASVVAPTQVGVLVDGVENADVSMHDFYHEGAATGISFRLRLFMDVSQT